MKENLKDVNVKAGAVGLRILDVTLGVGLPDGDSSDLVFHPKLAGFGAEIPTSFFGHYVEFQDNIMLQNPSDRSSRKFYRECGQVVAEHIRFAICSSLTQGYHGDLHNLHNLSMIDAHPHFYLSVQEVTKWKAVTGLLPELWGTQVMSESTRTCVKAEETASSNLTPAEGDAVLASSQEAFRRDREKALAWAGGSGFGTMGGATDAELII
eukprot:gnl/TRDRNA2_/TRDRNA2_177820_c1_seq3.p2 gnl/TRDRNA2_/TRDRNA2_177820_c1~~gnl/TRDRNA2_/TRDRNA2_177820_c1_seq3.p2  ORF type:complete len:210 (+),score=33.45 gnl/TRDRNA2_/TRDRNA2_177820_c1_seq3:725-1354(+)